MPEIVLRSVVFPAPFGPIRPTSCPRSAWRSKPSNSVFPSISYVRFSALIACGPVPFMVVLLRHAEGGVGRLRELLRPENPGEILGPADVPVGKRCEVLALDDMDLVVLDRRKLGEGLVASRL